MSETDADPTRPAAPAAAADPADGALPLNAALAGVGALIVAWETEQAQLEAGWAAQIFEDSLRELAGDVQRGGGDPVFADRAADACCG